MVVFNLVCYFTGVVGRVLGCYVTYLLFFLRLGVCLDVCAICVSVICLCCGFNYVCFVGCII